jgi:hypothetical protein
MGSTPMPVMKALADKDLENTSDAILCESGQLVCGFEELYDPEIKEVTPYF